ncbi:hypothetical protein BGW80DRAFT_1276706, partial [Lactifluus volemus]
MRPLACQRWRRPARSMILQELLAVSQYHHMCRSVFCCLLLGEETTHAKNVHLVGLYVHIHDTSLCAGCVRDR